MTKKIKSCPFCGGEAHVCEALDMTKWDYETGKRVWSGYYRCYCPSCVVSQQGHPSRKKAVKAWNKRAKEARR